MALLLPRMSGFLISGSTKVQEQTVLVLSPGHEGHRLRMEADWSEQGAPLVATFVADGAIQVNQQGNSGFCF